MKTRPTYTTDVSDTEWQIIEPLLPGPKQRGRKIAYERHEILNAIFYLFRNGCHCNWRDLPHDLPYRLKGSFSFFITITSGAGTGCGKISKIL